ncbi:MAG: helix-turn-helix domain-containing protein [Chloroflexi bacterium]|nr:helix-turn-helix domain-containing protein [Chloroflexota bacterium]MBU1746182.1 helix-turn-helix domain-containing protein [Chloroflexota bacterium]
MDINHLERRLTDVVARIAPWLAPLPTAYLVGRATVEHLHWPDLVGIIAAAIVESLGLATTVTALELREYNASKRKSDPGAPFGLAAGLVVVYLVVALALTVVLDTVPELARYAPAIFPLLSLAGMIILALRADHVRRLNGIAENKAAAREERAARRQQQRQHAADPAEPSAPPVLVSDSAPASPATYAEFIRQHPDLSGLTGRQIADLAGVHERTGRNWLARWRAQNEEV